MLVLWTDSFDVVGRQIAQHVADCSAAKLISRWWWWGASGEAPRLTVVELPTKGYKLFPSSPLMAQNRGSHFPPVPSGPAQVQLSRPVARGADPISPGQVHGRDLCESCLGQEVPVLCVAEECGAEQRHYYAVE